MKITHQLHSFNLTFRKFIKIKFFLYIILLLSTKEAMANPWPNYQCKILKATKVSEDENTICSGTLISKNKFITAAHCFDIQDIAGIDENYSTYSIDCPDGFKAKIKGVAVHPLYYDLNKNGLAGMPSTNNYNDIAIAIIDKESSINNFPTLTTMTADLNEIREGSCRLLGYSPEMINSTNNSYCKEEVNGGCYRDNLTIRISSENDHFCNFSSGEGCQLSSVFKESTSIQMPLMISNPDYQNSTGRGDSGGGMLCKINSEELLVGVNSFSREVGIINLANKSEFINHYLEIKTIADFIKNSTSSNYGVTLSQDYVQMHKSKLFSEESFRIYSGPLWSILMYRDYITLDEQVTTLLDETLSHAFYEIEQIFRNSPDDFWERINKCRIMQIKISTDDRREESWLENTTRPFSPDGALDLIVAKNASAESILEKINCR